MRIIAGEFRSRRLKTLPGTAIRPTSDKLRGTLFNVLAARVPGAFWYDCYAGTGAVGLEALSRGAEHVVFLESNRVAARVIFDNVRLLGVLDRATILEQPVAQALAAARHPAGIVFLDPPYDAEIEYRRVLTFIGDGGLLSPDGRVIAEHARRAPLPEQFCRLQRYRTIEQGDAALSFFRFSK